MPAGFWWRLGLWLMVGLVVYFLCAWGPGCLGENEME
jgi:hypothetical protein